MNVQCKKFLIEPATHFDVLWAVQKMQEYSGTPDIKAAVLYRYFIGMTKNDGYNEPEQLYVADTFYALCCSYYSQNFAIPNPKVEFAVPEAFWENAISDRDTREFCIETLKKHNCISYRERYVAPQSYEVFSEPSSQRFYVISRKTLYLLVKFAKFLFDDKNFE